MPQICHRHAPDDALDDAPDDAPSDAPDMPQTYPRHAPDIRAAEPQCKWSPNKVLAELHPGAFGLLYYTVYYTGFNAFAENLVV